MNRKPPIPYQTNEKAFTIRKIRANFDAATIDEHPHRHEFIEVLYIKSGSGKHEIDGKEYDLAANTVYVISKGQVHHFLYAKNLEGTLIRFHDSILPSIQSSKEGFYYNLLFALRNHNELSIESSDSHLVELLLTRMLQEYAAQPSKTLDLSLIQHLFYPILILLNRYVVTKSTTQDYDQDLFAQFTNILEKSFKQHHDLSFYAEEMGITTRKLTTICREKSGKSAKKIINERVLTGAKRLIKYTSLPLKEIIDLLGFKDVGYFCRYFKKSTGMTPSEYKSNTTL